MKIRSPWLIKLLAFIGAWIIRLWMGTVQHQLRELGQPAHPRRPELKQHFIYAFWHENILVPCYQYQGANVRIMISEHADGELIAQICRYFRLGSIRGSTTRGGIKALRQMLRAGQHGHLVMIPDGPRGPRRHVHPGLIYLAAHTGLPIVVCGIGYRRPWRLRSWDRFAIPKPWSFAASVMAPPLVVPPDLDKDQMEHYRQLVEDTFVRMSALAEQWAETGRWPKIPENVVVIPPFKR